MALGFQIELEFGNVVYFLGEGKTGVPGEKPLGARTRTNNKLNPHMTPRPGIEPGPHWWEACAIPAPHIPFLSNKAMIKVIKQVSFIQHRQSS